MRLGIFLDKILGMNICIAVVGGVILLIGLLRMLAMADAANVKREKDKKNSKNNRKQDDA